MVNDPKSRLEANDRIDITCIWPMTTPRPELPWYQFSLRSLLLFTAFVAVLCAIGVRMHWAFSAILATIVLIGGVAGRIVAGTRRGFMQGALGAVQFFLLAVVGSLLLIAAFPQLFHASGQFWVVIYGTAVLSGGVLGGSTARFRSKR